MNRKCILNLAVKPESIALASIEEANCLLKPSCT